MQIVRFFTRTWSQVQSLPCTSTKAASSSASHAVISISSDAKTAVPAETPPICVRKAGVPMKTNPHSYTRETKTLWPNLGPSSPHLGSSWRHLGPTSPQSLNFETKIASLTYPNHILTPSLHHLGFILALFPIASAL